jgi:hypothetical protein
VAPKSTLRGVWGRFPGWAKWPIIAAGVLLSPVLAFLLALSLAVLVAVIKEAGLAGSLAAFGTGAITFLGVRRLRGPRVSDT